MPWIQILLLVLEALPSILQVIDDLLKKHAPATSVPAFRGEFAKQLIAVFDRAEADLSWWNVVKRIAVRRARYIAAARVGELYDTVWNGRTGALTPLSADE